MRYKNPCVLIRIVFFWSTALLLFLHFPSGCTKSNSTVCCGLDPRIRRILSPWAESERRLSLNAVVLQAGKSSIFIDVGTRKGVREAYVSTDLGESWRERSKETLGYSDLSVRDEMGFFNNDLISSQSPDLLLRNPTTFRFQFELSQTGGMSWQEIFPEISGGGKPRNFDLIGIGARQPGRVYAQIRLIGNDEDFCLYRSDDYGHTFRKVTKEVRYAVESRANPNLLIGVSNLRPGLPIGICLSIDGGDHWSRIPSENLAEPLVCDSGQPPIIRTWVEHDSHDTLINNDFAISQIETDPSDVNTFYVVTQRGLFATRDQGLTFRLLPLAIEYIRGVDNVAVDPNNSRYVYASVKRSDLYRSSDRGCNWQKLEIPGK